MPMSSSVAVLGFLLLSGPAFAADVYSFTVDQQGDHAVSFTASTVVPDGSKKGKVTIDGRKYRLDLALNPESSLPYQAVISKDGGEHETALNLAGHTFYEPKAPDITSALFRLLPIGKGSVSNVKLDIAEAPDPEMMSGARTRRHEIKLSYDITLEISPLGGKGRAEIVRGKVNADAVYWLAEGKTPALPRLLRPGIRTGFAEIDAKLAGTIAAFQGLPVKQQVTISTEGDRGTEARTSTRTVVLQNHKTQETKASVFEVPGGFKMQEPELSRPRMIVPPG
jgi:hypothetical protein